MADVARQRVAPGGLDLPAGGLPTIEFGDHQRFTLLWSISAALVMLVAALVFGVTPFTGRAA